MRITDLKINGYKNPIGYSLNGITLSWSVCETLSKKQRYIRVKVAKDKKVKDILFDSGRVKEYDGRGYELPFTDLKPRTRYYVQVEVVGDADKAKSEVAFFETSKLNEKWVGEWITASTKVHPEFIKKFTLAKKCKSARLYVCGLGLYYAEINGKKVTEDRFAPHFTDYNEWVQYQSYDVTSLIKKGKNSLNVTLGNGWYKGVFGLNLKECLYGSEFALLYELHIIDKDDNETVIYSDTTTEAVTTDIIDSSIYHGIEVKAGRRKQKLEVIKSDFGFTRLKDSMSLPVVVKDEIVPEIITAANGERLLDFKQNMVGTLRCKFREEKGTVITVKVGEVLQGGNYFNANYREARSEIIYVSDGKEVTFEPKFTSFGFRYVKVRGVTELRVEDFIGLVLYSDIDERGSFITSNEKVNRLIKNAYWGIRGNSLDLPTDCPQRNERLGWTGDCQAISGTSNRLFDMKAFYKKWLKELSIEQDKDGCVTDVVPKIDYGGKGACAWGDAAVIVPYNTYVLTGDITVIRDSYDSMKAWVEFCKAQDKTGENLRYAGEYRQYGDWLAIDNPKVKEDPDCPDGYTDFDFLCSAYYGYSAEVLSKTAAALKKTEDAEYYAKLSESVKKATYEKFLKNPTPKTSTQTALVLAIAMGIAPKKVRAKFVQKLYKKFESDGFILKTGFIGTIFALKTLCENGMEKLAYDIFLSENYPGWLYAINLGATTIWERWNSLMPDGSVNKGGMNSFNHYAFGMVVEWMFTYITGIKVSEKSVAFKEIEISPIPDKRLTFAKGEINTAGGLLVSSYEYKGNDVEYSFTIPFNATATVKLKTSLSKLVMPCGMIAKEVGEYSIIKLTTGFYKLTVRG